MWLENRGDKEVKIIFAMVFLTFVIAWLIVRISEEITLENFKKWAAENKNYKRN